MSARTIGRLDQNRRPDLTAPAAHWWWRLLTIGTLAAGLVLGVFALVTVHQTIPFALECDPPGPGPNDPGPDPDFLTPLVKALGYLSSYLAAFAAGLWAPHSLLRGRPRWVRAVAGLLLAPLALGALGTADLLFNVAPAHGLHLLLPPTHGVWLTPGICPPPLAP
ncbi:hypothetical protein [Streptomyces rubellomurinus]|uniref:Uncharacterized protein n=2 Tax=Streptomyces TaxID=1883 RepID=A0A0F2TFB1_STRR3|nr:hypothetical protein [Streptomyces rubellomurinus]KJS56577.1 hypothetical protein VM98_06560 [Streptomyces rubellomurinus subsp. indigoferus]KJS60950.1 hypothetical protein VM95_18260 [Streptomyces rubellomurinus]